MIHWIYPNRDKNSHYGRKIGNKNIHHEDRKNSNHKHPWIDLHIEIKHANHREVGKGMKKTH